MGAEQFATMKGCHLPRVQKSCMCIYRSAEAMRTYVGAHYLFINCCFSLSLCLYSDSHSTSHIFSNWRRVSERAYVSVCPHSIDESVVYTQRASERMYLCTDTQSRRERYRNERKKVSMRARSFHTQTHTQTNIRSHSNQRWRSLILLLLYGKQIKHAYRSTMRLEWVTNNNNKWNQRRCDWIKSYHLLCTLCTTHCKVYLVDGFLCVLSPSPHATVWIYE